ncbi:hypothetical protein HK101_007670 [Irineochytrium annulatum]|nr:hypothetical protein HK101_007670 [Irineochytrium annulatum]
MASFTFMRLFGRATLYGGLGSVGLGSGAGAYFYNTDDGVRRSVALYSNLAPVILHYRLVELKHKLLNPPKEEANKDWDALNALYPERVKACFSDLRGFYIKVGQLMANRADVLSKEYIEALRTLEDAVPPMLSGAEAREVIRKSLGLKSLDDAFVGFEDQPIGSASIGQVHRAVEKKSGKKVAIKVQTPGVEALFRADIKTARQFCSIFEQVILFDEIEKIFVTEFDYRCEAENLALVSKNMRPYSRLVKVPEPFPALCSKDVLTMEYLRGPKLVDGARQMGREYAAMKGTTLEAMERDIMDKYNKEGMPPPYSGPSAFQVDLYRAWVKVKDNVLNLPLRVYNATFGMLGAGKFEYFKSFMPLNSARIMQTLLVVHGHQMIVNGLTMSQLFNSDPHPGNFLLLEDGRIGLLDYGQVKKLTRDERRLLARLVVALAGERRDAILGFMKESGYKSKYMDPEVCYRMAVVSLDRDGRDVTDGLNLQQFIDKMFAQDPWDTVVDTMIMPTRMSILLRGVGLMMKHPVSVAKAWAPIAEKMMKDEGIFSNKMARKLVGLYVDALQRVEFEKGQIQQCLESLSIATALAAADEDAGKRKKRKLEDKSRAGTPTLKKARGATPSETFVPLQPGAQVVVQVDNDYVLAIVLQWISKDRMLVSYEVEDAEDDEQQPGQRKRWFFPLKKVIPIPDPKAKPEYPANHIVLALYPNSSCFYKAVVAKPPSKNMDSEGGPGFYVVRFDDDNGFEREIDPRNVLDMPKQSGNYRKLSQTTAM